MLFKKLKHKSIYLIDLAGMIGYDEGKENINQFAYLADILSSDRVKLNIILDIRHARWQNEEIKTELMELAKAKFRTSRMQQKLNLAIIYNETPGSNYVNEEWFDNMDAAIAWFDTRMTEQGPQAFAS